MLEFDSYFIVFGDLVTWELDSDNFTLDADLISNAYFTSYVTVEGDLPYSWSYCPAAPVPGVLSVFSGVGSFLAGAVSSAITMFYTAEGGLSVLGILAVASLGLAVILLLMSLIAGWLKFK